MRTLLMSIPGAPRDFGRRRSPGSTVIEYALRIRRPLESNLLYRRDISERSHGNPRRAEGHAALKDAVHAYHTEVPVRRA